jgi:hypothetical protein
MLNYAGQYRFHYPPKGFQVQKEKLFGGASAKLSAIATSRYANRKELDICVGRSQRLRRCLTHMKRITSVAGSPKPSPQPSAILSERLKPPSSKAEHEGFPVEGAQVLVALVPVLLKVAVSEAMAVD